MTNEPQQESAPEDPRNDPTVEEIRAIRRRLWKEAGGDVRRYLEQMRERAVRREQETRPGDETAKRPA